MIYSNLTQFTPIWKGRSSPSQAFLPEESNSSVEASKSITVPAESKE